jgi:membrane-anchored protein YejM (alkaline phosphatase superfamily)
MTDRKILPAAAAVVLAAWAVFSAGCSSKDPGPRNVLFITLDTLRADHVSALPGGRARTPALDGLASRGIFFENAWSLIPITLPAHATMFFGEPPHERANYNNGEFLTPRRNRPSFVQAFRKEGYATAAFVSLGVMTREFGLAEGFDHYEDAFPDTRWYLNAHEVNRRVIPWLESHYDKPFFLWVHYSDPHAPYSPPDLPKDLKLRLNGRILDSYRLNDYAWIRADLDLKAGKNVLEFDTENPFFVNPLRLTARLDNIRFGPEDGMKDVRVNFGDKKWNLRPQTTTRYFRKGARIILTSPTARRVKVEFIGELHLPPDAARDYYGREVEFMDGRIGELLSVLDGLGLTDKTAVVAVGDHGEGLGEYLLDSSDYHFGHIKYLQKIYLNVPLIVSLPGHPGNGTRRTEPVTHLDLAPTFYNLIGFKPLRGLTGRDLLSLPPGATIPIFAETYRPESDRNRFALIEAPWHMILDPETGRHRMYNMAADPAESANLWNTPDLPPDVARSFEKRLNDFAREILANKKEKTIDSRTEEMLKSLGYIGK